ncbi:MAG: hypothetical protein LBU67_05330 [Oscillospiraceae bacterium]|jgi:hypothetical protein|nr:hypothetical protein [Oscillospiraceae bacterium]
MIEQLLRFEDERRFFGQTVAGRHDEVCPRLPMRRGADYPRHGRACAGWGVGA